MVYHLSYDALPWREYPNPPPTDSGKIKAYVGHQRVLKIGIKGGIPLGGATIDPERFSSQIKQRRNLAINVDIAHVGDLATAAMELLVKWAGKEYKIADLAETETVLDLKMAIHKETGVMPSRQKLLGLKIKGKPATDEVSLQALKLKSGTKVMMIGSREEEIEDVMKTPDDLPEVVNDFDIDDEEVQTENREEFLAKVEKRIREYKIKTLNPSRPGKKLLVLDIDYTIFDHCSTAHTAAELMRPFLHEFLTSAYDDYDIAIWSATSMKWIEVKMKELGVTTNPNYKVAFYLDSSAMISVCTPKYGMVDVKPLGVIWGLFEQYDQKNTIMFDDLRRNFLMNPQNGLKIRAFKKAHINKTIDRELLKLAKYLKAIAKKEDLSELNHKHWERYQNHDDSS